MSQNTGKISQIIGPVVDVIFDKQGLEMPDIYDALEIKRPDGSVLVVECQQHIGERTVRTIAMDSTDGLQRGMEVLATGLPITMPIGEQIKGRLMNVTGEAIDGIGTLDKKGGYPIHRKPPAFDQLSTEKEVLFTGIKVMQYWFLFSLSMRMFAPPHFLTLNVAVSPSSFALTPFTFLMTPLESGTGTLQSVPSRKGAY